MDRAHQDGAGRGGARPLIRARPFAPRTARLGLLLALAPAALVAACGPPKDPVAALLAELEKAAEARDAGRFGERLSPTFRGGGEMDRATSIATLRRDFAAYESVALTVYGVEVERTAGGAHVRCVVEFSGRGRALGGLQGLLPPEAAYRFDLQAADEGGTWRVTRADWQEAQPAAPSASP